MTTAMLLAAGRGERLRPLTDRVPKALVEVAGKSLLERHLARLGRGGVTTAVINLGWLGDDIVARIGSGRRYGLQVVYSPEYDNVLETGGGIERALPLLGEEPFWVLNADIACDWELPADDPLTADADGHLVLVPNPAYRDRGDFALSSGRVRNAGDAPLTFAGIARYRPAFFAGCTPGRFGLAPLLRSTADAGRLSGERFEGRWADVGTPARLEAAHALFQSRDER